MKRSILIAMLVASIPTMVQAESPSPFGSGDGTISNIQMAPSGNNNGTTVVLPTGAVQNAVPTDAPAVQAPAPNPVAATPAPQAPAKKTHKVVRGDTLWGIAQKYLGDGSRYREIIELNKAKYPSLLKNPDLIVDGWVLEVPDTSAQATQPGTNGATNGSNGNAANNGSNGNNGNAATPTPNPANNWTLEQKRQKLQDSVNAMNLQLLKEGKRMTQLNEATIREMIKRGHLSEQDWMAMNPPAGKRWALDGAKVVLVDGNNVVVTTTGTTTGTSTGAAAGTSTGANAAAGTGTKTSAATGTKTSTSTGTTTSTPVSTGTKTSTGTGTGTAVNPAVVQTAAEKNFAADLKSIGMPDVFKGGDPKPYRDAITAGQKLLPGDWAHWSPFAKFSENYDPFSDLHVLQNRLMEAQKLYEKKVREGDVNSGIFRGDSIETAAKKVQEAKEMLSKKWNEFKPVYQQASQVAASAKTELTQIQKDVGPARKRLEELRANPNPNDASEISTLIRKIDEFEKKSKDLQEKCDAFAKLTGVFGKP